MIDDLELARTLLEQGLATRDQLRQARQLQLTQDTSLYLAMVEHDIIEESVLVEVAASMLNVPFVTLADRNVPPEVVNLVPVDMARLHGVLPLELREDPQGELLLLAMRDPLDIMAMDDISTHVNVGIQPILCGPKDLFQGIERMQQARPEPLSLPRNNSVDFGEFSTSAQHEQDSLSTEDSWAVFFDDALAQPEPSDAQQMRDRPNTMALDLMDIDEILDDDEADDDLAHQDPLSMLDEPGEPSSLEMDSLDGWDVDSSLGSKKSPPPPPLPTSTSSDDEPEQSFDALYAAIDEDDQSADPAPSGTMIAGPSLSLTGEHDADEIKKSLEVSEEELRAADDALSGLVESEVIGEAPSIASSVIDDGAPEPIVADEAGSQTQMGNLGQMLAGTSDSRAPELSTHDREQLSLNQSKHSFTMLGTPKRLNADGTERPMLVIKSDGEDLFGQALADIDAQDAPGEQDASGEHARDVPSEELEADAVEEQGEEVDAEEGQEVPEPAAALGRLKLKRVAVSPSPGLLDAPVVERSRIVEQENVVIQGTSQTEGAEPEVAEEPESTEEGVIQDILADDDILAGFQAALDEDEDEDPEVFVKQAQPKDPEGLEATREFDALELFSFTGDGEEGLDEATNAAMGEAHARIERLNKMIRNANNNARGEQVAELGAQGTDGEVDAPASGMRVVQPTRSNQALTRDSLNKMRQSTMDLSSDLLFSGTNSPGLPSDIDDARLLRAALMILISQDLIKIDELVALAKSLPPSS